ncbi:MAG: hypothetical protein HOM68_01915 [Gemmatimonadetes bacterium]|jgi:TolB-like protein|nr:hypothetical protein [Gemmatimonadota bacterium]MBT5055270.1 hypothetical protein [Gemmatimonadota bacterium]MBT5142860.1 hypothetical protein [Gemmatimonadota bacterium]MBT5589453.1 hypothetical protein [Gemmatimonadota bacterium]MBT5960006.1 hypothetical protein [Gemmatimonadota bacterium]
MWTTSKGVPTSRDVQTSNGMGRTREHMSTAHRRRIIGLRIIYTLLMFVAPVNAATRIALLSEPEQVTPEFAQTLAATLASEAGVEVVQATAGKAESHGHRSQITLHLRTVVNAYRLGARVIHSDDGRVLAQEQVRGGKGQVFDLVDELASRLQRHLGGHGQVRRSVAVMAFENRADQGSLPFVTGIQQMLMTALRQDRQLTLIEPSEIATARTSTVDVGRWLGADVSIDGDFTDVLRAEVEVVTANGRHLGTYAAEAPRADGTRLAQEIVGQLAPVLRQHRRDLHTVALLRFENHSEDRFSSFVEGMADMLTTGLRNSSRLRVIERTQIETAMLNFNVEMSGPIDSETAVEVGNWLGADAVVIGSFLRFGDVFRIDARMIDAQTGEVTVAESVRGTEQEVMGLVDELSGKLVARFESETPEESTGTGTVKIVFQATRSEMGERPSFHHICKLYVDGKFIGLSRPVTSVGKWETLFSRSLRGGRHRVEVVHGFVRGQEWDGQMPVQPRAFDIDIEPEGVTTLQYEYEVGWFEDKYVYE